MPVLLSNVPASLPNVSLLLAAFSLLSLPTSVVGHGGYFERQEGVIASPHVGFTASSGHMPDLGVTLSAYTDHEFTQMPFYHHPPGMPGSSWGPQLAWPGIGMGVFRLDGALSAEALLKAGIGEFPRPDIHWGVGAGLAWHDGEPAPATELWTVFVLGWRWKTIWSDEPRHSFTAFFPFVVARP